jgi:DNA-binding NtrC family response regulator
MNPSAHILVVEDKQSFRFMLKTYLETAGFKTTCVTGGTEALAVLAASEVDMVISDLVMPGMDGMALLHEVRSRFPTMPFLILTAHGTIDNAVATMKQGATDYLLKPIRRDELILLVSQHLENASLRYNHDQMAAELHGRFGFQNMSSIAPAMGDVLTAARQVVDSPGTTVAIYGESGVGKEVLARAIHTASGCSPATFVAINCAAIPETLLESELFGHVKGAFTGADRDRKGKCWRARWGTLFLDEIGDMPLLLQAKLLRLVEDRVFEKVGSDASEPADFRVIVATHHNLEEDVLHGGFRSDLFHRLNIFPLSIPPLRQRREDIPQLAEQFMSDFRRHQGKSLPGLSITALECLMAHDWPGNVRELRNRLEYATIITNGELIRPEHLRLQHGSCQESPISGRITLCFDFDPDQFSYNAVIQRLLDWAMEKSNDNKSAAARLLKTSRKLFY